MMNTMTGLDKRYRKIQLPSATSRVEKDSHNWASSAQGLSGNVQAASHLGGAISY